MRVHFSCSDWVSKVSIYGHSTMTKKKRKKERWREERGEERGGERRGGEETP